MQFLTTFLRCVRRRRLCVGVAVVIFAAVYGIGGTKYTSLRLTSLDVELQSLKTVTFNEAALEGNTNNQNDNKGCFWYSDNLFHLMCAVLTDRPVQFHAVANRVPRMQRELFQYLDVKRCESAKEKPSNSRGSGWEDLERKLDQVKMNLQLLQERCDAETSQNATTISSLFKSSSSPSATTQRKKCLHLARNFNRRLQNCSAPLDECDAIVFDDTLPFCPLWNVFQQYDTIISPHGFQLALPILAHAALDRTQHKASRPPKLHIIEIRWPGYQDGSYEEMVGIFQDSMNHTLIAGHTPNGKLNDKDGNCQKVKACRKTERQRDLYCSATAQEQMARAIAAVDGGSSGEYMENQT